MGGVSWCILCANYSSVWGFVLVAHMHGLRLHRLFTFSLSAGIYTPNKTKAPTQNEKQQSITGRSLHGSQEMLPTNFGNV